MVRAMESTDSVLWDIGDESCSRKRWLGALNISDVSRDAFEVSAANLRAQSSPKAGFRREILVRAEAFDSSVGEAAHTETMAALRGLDSDQSEQGNAHFIRDIAPRLNHREIVTILHLGNAMAPPALI